MSDDLDDLDELDQQLDVRRASVVWYGSADVPECDFAGCSVWEAVGMLRAALLRLEDRAAELLWIPELDDNDEDDE